MKKIINEKFYTKYQKAFEELYTIPEILSKSLLITIVIWLIDYFNIFSKIAERKEFIFIGIIILLLALIKILDFKPWNLYKLTTVNYTDSFLVSSIIALFVYSIKIDICNKEQYYKTITIICLSFLLLILELIRIRKINKIEKIEEPANVYDLKELYDGKIENKNNGLILIKEKEVDYDLLERGNIINKLYEVVTKCYNGEKFVLSLQGEWGSGKTTIINNFKKLIKDDSNIIIIDDFDPWSYEDEQAMFKGMFDSIMKKIGINFSIIDISNFLNFYIDAIFNNSKYENKYKIAKKYYLDIDKSNKLKSIINTYLKNNNKKILFIIDNIERADKSNINLLFKLVNNIFDFDNVIYLLSFDDNRMKEIFKNDFNSNYKYLKKIIQLEVKVPKIDRSVILNVVGKCIGNIIKLYNIDVKEKDIKEIAELISMEITDLRDLKIYLNSVISFNYASNKRLNLHDTLLLELIKSKNIELYEEIWKNGIYFVSEDVNIYNKVNNTDIKAFNKEAKEYFDKLFKNENNRRFGKTLASLFPYVKNYLNENVVKPEYDPYPVSKSEYHENLKSEKICNARYFDLYFTQCSNEFTNINKNIELFVRSINSENKIELIENEFEGIVNLYTNWIQKYTFETLQLYLDDIRSKYLLLKIIDKHFKEYDNTTLFFGISALQRMYVIMADLIFEISIGEFDEYLKSIENDYSKINILQEIESKMQNVKKIFPKDDTRSEYKKEKLNEYVNEMTENVISNNIDILNKKYYFYNNIWGIYKVTKDNMEKRKTYIKNILNKENIFRFLNDLLSMSLSTIRIWICYKKINNRRIFKYRRNR